MGRESRERGGLHVTSPLAESQAVTDFETYCILLSSLPMIKKGSQAETRKCQKQQCFPSWSAVSSRSTTNSARVGVEGDRQNIRGWWSHAVHRRPAIPPANMQDASIQHAAK